MGCFIGCFGVSTKKKRTKPASLILHGDLKLVSYEPLDFSVSTNLDSNSQLSEKPKERPSIKITKEVRFNLNVQTYEPIPAEKPTFHFLQSVEEEEENEKNGAEEAGKGSSLPSLSYPTNHRYQNYRESSDDESDLEDDGDDDDDSFYDNDDVEEDRGPRREEFLDELKSIGNGNARIRSQDLCSVLIPVENTAQWKEIKARSLAAEEEPKIHLGSNCFSPN